MAQQKQDQKTPRQWRVRRKPSERRDTAGPLLLYGLHTVAAALANPKRRKHRVICTGNARDRLQEIFARDYAADMPWPDHLPVDNAPAAQIGRRLGPDAVHQGCLLECEPLDHESRLEPGTLSRALVLDQITDPHNVGAILRTASAFALDAVITTARHSPSETGVLAKSASGALDHVPLVRVRNLADAMQRMTEAGITLIGLDSDAGDALGEHPLAPPYALVLGSEGKGLREKTQGLCTNLVRLDMPGRIRSLNVSNAAAIALFAARQMETH